MKKRMLFLLLILLIFTGCASSEKLSAVETEEPHIKPIDEVLVVEACETLSSDPADYLAIAEGTDSTKIKFNFNTVNSTVCADYPVSASYGDEIVEFILQIVDTTPPELVLKADPLVFRPYDLIYDDYLVDAYDLSDVSMEYNPYMGHFYAEEPGEYEVEILAKDAYKNRSNITVTLSIAYLETTLNPETIEQIQKDDSLSQLYKDYLLGNTAAVIGKDVDFEMNGLFSDPILPGQSASLEDMYSMINSDASFNAKTFLTNVRYGLLDCGMDGTKELALQYSFNCGGEKLNMITVLHEEDGILMLNFADTDGYRHNLYVYSDGSYYYEVSHSYTEHSSSYGILDASGSLEMIYDCYTTFSGYYGADDIDPDNLAIRDYFGYDSVDEITDDDKSYIKDELKNHFQLNRYTIGTETYFNCYPESNPNDSDKLSLPYYLSLCEKNGTAIYTDEEIETIIEEYKASLGFSDWEEKRGEKEELSWQQLLGDGFEWRFTK